MGGDGGSGAAEGSGFRVAGGPNHKNGHIFGTTGSLGTSCTTFESWPHSGFNDVHKIPKLGYLEAASK